MLATTLVVGSAGGAILHAQDSAPGTKPTPDIEVPMSKQAQLSPTEMESEVDEKMSQMAAQRKQVDNLRAAAKASKDIIKLNCINDKLAKIDELLRIATASKTALDVAIATRAEQERYHRFAMLTIAAEKVSVLTDEAQSCVGDEIDYQGPLDVGLDEPTVPDDPTLDDPLDDDGPGDIEPPGYASPFT
jgi:hypothetical protein